MVKLKSLHLENFGGYINTDIDFTANNSLAMFFGPNGIGKTTILDAIKFVSNPIVFAAREAEYMTPQTMLRSYVYDEHFIPYADHIMLKTKKNMEVSAVFNTSEGDKQVIMNNDGFVTNELPIVHNGHCFFIDADHPMNWSTFQLHEKLAGRFVSLAEEIYGFPCDLDSEVTDWMNGEKHMFFQDIILTKGNTKVHFAKMSAGEKKIATLIKQLCNPDMVTDKDIIMVDNIDLHVYFARHAIMLEGLLRMLPDKQFFLTCHSGTLIQYASEKYPQSLYDMGKIKGIY